VEDPATRPPLNTGGNVVGSDKNGLIPSFEAGTNFAESYVNRIYGYFIPPTTGDYVFFIAADDDSDLFLSTDADPANKHLIAQEAGWSGVRNYSQVGGGSTVAGKRSDLSPNSAWPETDMDPSNGIQIHLTQGTKYYIEAVHHEGGGGDNIAVTYSLAGQVAPSNGSAPRLQGSVIATDVPAGTVVDGTITITTQPTGGTFAMAGAGTTLTVAGTTTSAYPITYQWYKDGVAIAGAAGTSLSIPGPVVPSQAGSYTVKLSIPKSDGTLNTVTSSPAVIAIPGGASFITGSLKYEYFPGKDRPSVENGTAGAAQSPGGTVGNDKSGAISIFESGTNFADNYANRISGWFVPAITGDYTFLVAADDDTDLFLSTDESPANKLMIAQETGWSGVRNYSTVGGGTLEAKNSSTFAGNAWPTDADNDSSNGKQIHLVRTQSTTLKRCIMKAAAVITSRSPTSPATKTAGLLPATPLSLASLAPRSASMLPDRPSSSRTNRRTSRCSLERKRPSRFVRPTTDSIRRPISGSGMVSPLLAQPDGYTPLFRHLLIAARRSASS